MKYTGLSRKEAEEKLKQFGLNQIIEVNKIKWYDILLRQIKSNFIVYLLFAASFLSFLVGKNATAYTIIAVILLVVGVGFFQEYKAEKAVSALKKMITPFFLVIRDSKEIEIPSSQIVPGDVLILRTGERVPADGVLLSEKNISFDESILTGESREVRKIISTKENLDDENKAFMGSFVVSGKAILKVTHTGMNTKFGKIAKLISGTEKEILLQKKINKITKLLAFIGLGLSIFTGVLVLLKSSVISPEVIVDVLILVIAISVAAFPEGLPVVLITTLSSGAYRMAKKNAVVSRMSIIETLGETTVICSDKTGTITKGEMTVRKIYLDRKLFDVSGVGYERKGVFTNNKKEVDFKKEKDLAFLLKSAVLCNDSSISPLEENRDSFKITGTPTEASLLVLASKADIYKEDFNFLREEEIPFSSEKKIMSVLVSKDNKKQIYVKGALEYVLKKSTHILKNEKVYKITEEDRKRILAENKEMTKRALRTLAFAYKDKKFKDLESDFIFIGFVGMEDPPRQEVKETIVLCKKAGIKVKMITGDNKETAIAIAKEIGLVEGKVLEGFQIDDLSYTQLSKIIPEVTVFARVRPEHKLRIVRALKNNGEIVTMTGDGVNDAPALKEAHVGVAMGIAGTDVSRSVADLILKDDNFATIVYAVKEGRTIFTNIRKFMTYQLSCNFSELFIVIFGVLLASNFGWPIPILLPLQILFMNIVTDNLPAIALGFNPSSDDIMTEKPMKRQILSKNLLFLLFFSGILMTSFTLTVYYITFNVLGLNQVHAATTALLTLIMLEILGAFNFRSFRKGVLSRSLMVNKYLFYASIVSILATIAIIYTPLNISFGTTPLMAIEWIVAISIGLLFVIIFDLLKKINKHKQFWKVES